MSYKDIRRLIWNPIDQHWKIMHKGFPIGDGETIAEAVASARLVTDEPIYDKNEIIADYGELYEDET